MQFEKDLPQLVISCVRQLGTITHASTLQEQLLRACLAFMDHACQYSADTIQVRIQCYIGWTRCHSAAYAWMTFAGTPLLHVVALLTQRVLLLLLQNALLSAVTPSKQRLKLPNTLKAYAQLKP